MVESLLLHIGNHRCITMGRSMMAEFESLYASSHTSSWTDCRRHVLTFVPVFFPGSWQAFALDWQEGIELRMPTAFDNQDRTTGLGSQVDGSSMLNFVRNFGAKLDSTPRI